MRDRYIRKDAGLEWRHSVALPIAKYREDVCGSIWLPLTRIVRTHDNGHPSVRRYRKPTKELFQVVQVLSPVDRELSEAIWKGDLPGTIWRDQVCFIGHVREKTGGVDLHAGVASNGLEEKTDEMNEVDVAASVRDLNACERTRDQPDRVGDGTTKVSNCDLYLPASIIGNNMSCL